MSIKALFVCVAVSLPPMVCLSRNDRLPGSLNKTEGSLVKAAEQGDAGSMVKLGDLYSSGDRSIKKDEAKAGQW